MASSSVASKLLTLAKDGSVHLAVSVKPGVRVAGVAVTSAALELRVTAKPQDGEANKAVIKTVAELLGVAKSGVSVVRGHTGREKIISITGTSLESAAAALSRASDD
jgi:uncharacterized protein